MLLYKPQVRHKVFSKWFKATLNVQIYAKMLYNNFLSWYLANIRKFGHFLWMFDNEKVYVFIWF